MDVDAAIRHRRSHKLFDGTAVSRETLQELLELAIWAPNHKRTEPWRFTVVEGAAIAVYSAAVQDALLQRMTGQPDKLAAQSAKLRDILGGCGAIIGVSYVKTPADAVRDREDYAATCCAIQNLSLAAVARGVDSYWTTSDHLIGAALGQYWEIPLEECLIGAIVLGGARIFMPASRSKTVADVTRWR